MIRLCAIELTNFKNVEYGKIKFPSTAGAIEGADVVGIYGQNGSGKTAVIEALSIFDYLLSDLSLNKIPSECILFGKEEAELAIEVETRSEKNPSDEDIAYKILYRITLRQWEGFLRLSREQIFYFDLNAEKPRKTLLIDHRITEKDKVSSAAFSTTPKTTWNSLLSMNAEFETNFAVAERIAHRESTSFVLSCDLFTHLVEALDFCKNGGSSSISMNGACKQLVIPLLHTILSLKKFAWGLTVLTTKNHAHTSLNKLFIAPHHSPQDDHFIPDIFLDISKPAVLDRLELGKLDATLTAINTVLVSLVPGLTLEIKSLGSEMQNDGDIGTRIEVVSHRGDRVLPFRCESEGIKKIVAILGHLVDVYNNESKCVAIDELDAGIFEFLLGELLEVLAEHGKGQLIFTAHNLRPLETLPKQSLVFTTTNPERRYIGFSGVKPTNNLRDQYLRAINLGGQSETIYEPTSKYEIDSAFYEAGCVELPNDEEAFYGIN